MTTASANAWPPKTAAKCWRVAGPRAENALLLALRGKNSLPRSTSLKRKAEIDTLFLEGTRFYGQFFSLVWQPADQFGYAVLLRKQMGNAVARNRIKRRFREAIRLGKNDLTVTGRMAFRPKAIDPLPSLEDLKTDVLRIFRAINQGS